MPANIGGYTTLLEVFDMATSLAFYRDVLGFEVVPGGTPSWCILRLGDTEFMLNTAYDEDERPAVTEPGRTRGHGDTSLYFYASDPDAVHALLIEKGWPVSEPVVTHYGFRQVHTKDPDGFQLFFSRPVNRR
jgi:glyoxylase I family protein